MECRICGGELNVRQAVSCARCNSAFDRDCWIFNGGCATFGCGCKTYVGFRVTVIDTPLAIDESTPVTVREPDRRSRLMLMLPRWGRLLIPSLIPGLIGTTLVALAYSVVFNPTMAMHILPYLAACGIVPGVLAPLLGEMLRQRPGKACVAGCVVATVLYALSRVQPGGLHSSFVTLTIVAASIAANGLVEHFLAPYRFSRPPLPLLTAILRPVLTAVALAGMLVVLTVVLGPHPVSAYLTEIVVLGLFGFFVVAPPLELAKSAYYRKLIAESLRLEAPEE